MNTALYVVTLLQKLIEKATPGIGIITLTIFVYFFTSLPVTQPFRFQLLYISLFGLISVTFIIERSKQIAHFTKAVMFLLTFFVLLVVGTTGWFHSPFAFTLYFLIIALSFVFQPSASIGLVGTLFILVLIALPQGDPTHNFLTILSLLTIIPITFYVREQFLQLKEAENAILILRNNKHRYEDEIEEVMDNTISRFAAIQRAHLNTIKQLLHRFDIKGKEENKRIQKMLEETTEQSLSGLREFEEEATGEKLVTTPETVVSSKLIDAVKDHF